MERADLEQWIEHYLRLWRTPGTEGLADLFAAEISYRAAPWATPIAGLDALATFWEAERDGPDEDFTFASQVIAVDGDVGVVRVAVAYDRGTRWRDLWIVRLDGAGRCVHFEEWPFAPTQGDGH
jgi:hypothetical protein